MLLELSNQGIQNGSIGIVSVSLTTATTMEREKGFRMALKEDGRFHVLNTKYTNDNKVIAQWSTRSFLSDHPDLAGLFGTDEANTTAIGNTLQHTLQMVVGIGFDLTDKIQEYINQGYLKAVMVQNPYTMGYLGMAETIAVLNGYSTGPNFLNTGITIKTKYFRS
jgi:ribose transport system substrate-binding protein